MEYFLNITYRHHYDHPDAYPGYFSPTLDNEIRIEATAMRRTDLERFSFPPHCKPYFVLDLANDLPASFAGGEMNIDPTESNSKYYTLRSWLCVGAFQMRREKPDIVQLEINGEMHSNASDVTVQFLVELRVYTTLARHRNICAFLGSLENVGMVLEYLEGRTLYDVVITRPPLTRSKKIDYHNQLLDGLTHLHSYRLSHGDLSLLNVQVTHLTDTIKLLDLGRSVSADSIYASPEDQPADPFDFLHKKTNPPPVKLPTPKYEQIHPGTRPFSAPEILRGECQDARLADAYSFGMILVCLDRCESIDVKPWEQRQDLLPKDLFLGCEIFEERAREYLRKYNDGRRRLMKEDMIETCPGL